MMRYIKPKDVICGHAQDNPIPQWDIAIMCFHSIKKTLKIIDFFGGKALGFRLFSKCDVGMVFEAEIQGAKIGILGWCTGGGPMVASLIEELSVTGIKWLIGIGAAASIVPDLGQNEIILPTELLLNDGLSKVYSIAETITIDNDIYEVVKSVLTSMNCFYRPVKGATIEALYRQNEYFLTPLRQVGIQIVNWELTPFYVVSQLCNIRAVWIGHVSDVECEEVWQDWYTNRDKVTDTVAKIVNNIIKEIVRRLNEVKFKSDIELPC